MCSGRTRCSFERSGCAFWRGDVDTGRSGQFWKNIYLFGKVAVNFKEVDFVFGKKWIWEKWRSF